MKIKIVIISGIVFAAVLLTGISSSFMFPSLTCPAGTIVKNDVCVIDVVPALEPEPEPEPMPEPDTGEFRYGEQDCSYVDDMGDSRSCIVSGWTKPASELDCKKICASPGTKS